MINKVFRKIFGSRNDRIIKQHRKTVEKINQLEAEISALTDEQLAAKTVEYRERFQQGATLDDLLPEAFATAREAGKRVLNMRHFDVQLIGGMVLHSGKISEMRTGEGKTLVATLAAYLNALSGKGVHVVTVNDYLASRDAEWMGRLYGFLGLSTGVSIGGLSADEKKQAYAADITYGTNNEFGFDYLRDNMAFTSEEKVQRELNFAIVDEVDSILIDEARTPLIISGAVNDSNDLHIQFKEVVKHLKRGEFKEDKDAEEEGDFSVDEKNRSIHITEQGHQRVEEILVEEGILPANESLYSTNNINLIHYLNAALRASALFQLNVHYIIQNGEVVIVDEFSGRTMPGRRWSEGLHQAVEAKEGVKIQSENQTLASITFQNYFRLYNKLSGMTGTADTEASELMQIYNLEVVIIPTNKPMIRKDNTDLVYLTQEEKYEAIVEDVRDCVKRQQPVLVGTASIEVSEFIAKRLKQEKIQHNVLNAKQHENEAHIIEQAGQPGAVTIATNMAGRGTDIVLGGSLDADLAKKSDATQSEIDEIKAQWDVRHQAVLEAGGLHVIGSERHESRRIDNQLRGRSGRQGDNGSTRFYLSLQDDLMRIFASDRVGSLMKKLGMQQGEAIEHPWVNRAIENAQRKVEGHNFDIRKQVLDYDDVANDQRKVVYAQRNEMMSENDLSGIVTAIREDVLNNVISDFIIPGSMEEQWDIKGLEKALMDEFGSDMKIQHWLDKDDELNEDGLRKRILDTLIEDYHAKELMAGEEGMRNYEKYVLLNVLDRIWKEHLAAMDYLRQSIGLRGYAQKNPKQEYKRESFDMFSEMLDKIKHEAISILSKVEIKTRDEVENIDERGHTQTENVNYQHDHVDGMHQEPSPEGEESVEQPFVRGERKVGRNEPCWCGSGKKFKQCHGKLV
ncbi:MAG: preprotein translocase subunit SecA [Gammaproteobacteria bacterium]|nr:preprotein translocase subunit SecA [Gammaproteobacteria bacterium]